MRLGWILAVFTGCLVIFVFVMMWVSQTILHLDEAERQAKRKTAIEEKVRLALWRIDSKLSTLVVRENARPYFCYNAFYSSEKAYHEMLQKVYPGEILMASPLLREESRDIYFHFQFSPNHELTSPQIPNPEVLHLCKNYTTKDRIREFQKRKHKLAQIIQRKDLLQLLPPLQASPVEQLNWTNEWEEDVQESAQQNLAHKKFANSSNSYNFRPKSQRKVSKDWEARFNSYQQNAVYSKQSFEFPQHKGIQEGVMKPYWINGVMILARLVKVNGEDYIQGCWLNWEKISKELLADVREILPSVDLAPTSNAGEDQGTWILATFPARLILGEEAIDLDPSDSSMLLSLAAAWSGMLMAGLAFTLLLAGVIALSERRAAFVSAVTHELRTPLTTFRMYTEMLRKGMVKEEKKERYLQILQTEAERLRHLVENVLAYARLEKGRSPKTLKNIALPDMMKEILPRLEQRAQQAGINLQVDSLEPPLQVRTDADAVEQILFNLVDNACKYARETPYISISLTTQKQKAYLQVCDQGPGISPRESRKLFQPFCKSAKDAANSAPGVGLGLALSRRLARQVGGDLTLEQNNTKGACFSLILPIVLE